MEWIWIGLGLCLVPLLVATILLIWLHWHLRKNYLHIIIRIFQEVPLFNIPRGQPRHDAEDVKFSTKDGLALRGCYLKSPHQRRGVILFGLEFGSTRWSTAIYTDHLLEAGYDIFAYEPRNQGDSACERGLEPLHWVCDRDLIDAQAAIAYLKSRPDADKRGIGLFGISKGAGAGMAAAVTDPYIRCAVTDGMFGSISTVLPYMRKFMTIYNESYVIQGLLPWWYYATLAHLAIRTVGKERHVRFLHLERAVRQFRRPLLSIHGADDNYIRPEMARRLFNMAREPKEFWLIPGANHNQGPHVAAEEYSRRVREFFDKYLAAAN